MASTVRVKAADLKVGNNVVDEMLQLVVTGLEVRLNILVLKVETDIKTGKLVVNNTFVMDPERYLKIAK